MIHIFFCVCQLGHWTLDIFQDSAVDLYMVLQDNLCPCLCPRPCPWFLSFSLYCFCTYSICIVVNGKMLQVCLQVDGRCYLFYINCDDVMLIFRGFESFEIHFEMYVNSEWTVPNYTIRCDNTIFVPIAVLSIVR